MTRLSAPRARIPTSLTVFALCLVAFPLRSENYSYDAVDYATAVRDGVHLFHPHHLIYNALGRALFVALHTVGLRVTALPLLATLNALLSAATLALLASCLGALRAAPLLALLCASCYGILFLGTSVEVYPLQLIAEVAALRLLLRGMAEPAPPPLRPAELLGAGLLAGVAMLAHQTGIFILAPLGLLLAYRDRDLPLPRRALRLFWTLGLALCTCGAVYLAVAVHLGVFRPRDFTRWLLLYTHTDQFRNGVWGGGLSLARLPAALMGICGALTYPAFVDRLGTSAPSVIELACAALVVVALVGLIVVGARARAGAPLDTADRAVRRALVVWAVLHGGFTLWWEPSNLEFWLLLLPAATLLLGQRLRRAARPPGARQLLGLAALLFLGNLGTRVLPDRLLGSDVQRTMAALARAGTHPGDVVFGNIWDIEPFSRYFLGGPLRLLSLARVGYAPGEREAALRAYQKQVAEEIAAAAARGRPVLLLETEPRPTLGQRYGAQQWSAADFARCYAPLLAGARQVGTYPAFGATFRLWRVGSL